MTKQEILTKAIEKAIEGGFKVPDPEYSSWEITEDGLREDYSNYVNFERVIFSHSFLKAFFGELVILTADGEEEWKHHAQQMVISEDPIGYLSKFV